MRNHKLFYGSSYDRGLDQLLKLWPKIIEKFPDATLDVCYGWNLFDAGYANNPERMAWKERVNKLMEQKGIIHHGRVSQKELGNIRKQCGIWVYPTYFTEINCITALECQRDGCVPCVINLAALDETVQSGRKTDGDIYDEETQEAFINNLFELMGDTSLWEAEQKKGIEHSKKYNWERISREWERYFKA